MICKKLKGVLVSLAASLFSTGCLCSCERSPVLVSAYESDTFEETVPLSNGHKYMSFVWTQSNCDYSYFDGGNDVYLARLRWGDGDYDYDKVMINQWNEVYLTSWQDTLPKAAFKIIDCYSSYYDRDSFYQGGPRDGDGVFTRLYLGYNDYRGDQYGGDPWLVTFSNFFIWEVVSSGVLQPYVWSDDFAIDEGTFADGYNEGYTDGESDGYAQGFGDGRQDGYDDGYDYGYTVGKADGELNPSTGPAGTIGGLMLTIVTVPLTILNGFAPFAVYEVPIMSIIISFMFVALIIWFIKKLL